MDNKFKSMRKVCDRCGCPFRDMDDFSNAKSIFIDGKMYTVCWVCHQQWLPLADEKQKLKEKMIQWIQRR